MRLAGADGPVDAVFVAHADTVDFELLERAARAVIGGARLLTASYAPAYAGANGPILSRGAMTTAAIAKASSTRPVIVGKPSKAAWRTVEERLRVPAHEIAMIGDDLTMDVRLGRMGGARTVLCRERDHGPARARRHSGERTARTRSSAASPSCSTSSRWDRLPACPNDRGSGFGAGRRRRSEACERMRRDGGSGLPGAREHL